MKLWLVVVAGALLVASGIDAVQAIPRHARYAEVQSAFHAPVNGVPPEFQRLTDARRERQWSTWIADHDRHIRARLAQGDDDTLINWMLFGVSFTSLAPAVSDGGAGDPGQESRRVAALIRARARELVTALAAPTDDERLIFARRLLEQRHLSFDSDADRAAAVAYLLGGVVRVANEQRTIDRELETARGSRQPAFEIETSSRVFRSRGLSLDTSLAPNYAIDLALMTMSADGVLRNGAVKRVAIVGPGLDFSDKDSGFDFYPQQTLQPFALFDSLRRLQLGPADVGPEIVLFDISPRVIDHVTRAVTRAARGEGYTLHLPLDRGRGWLPSFRKYWEHFGEEIAAPVMAPIPRAIADVAETRAVRVPPRLVQRLSTVDLNIVTDRLDGERYDLIIATNVFVYYDVFDKILALGNINSMLNPGGFLLSNNLMPEPGIPTLRFVGSCQTPYWLTQSSNPGAPASFGDHVFWYQRQVD